MHREDACYMHAGTGDACCMHAGTRDACCMHAGTGEGALPLRGLDTLAY